MLNTHIEHKHVPFYLRNSFLVIVVFFFIFSRFVMGLNVLMLRNFRLFADVTTQDLLTLINEQRQKNGLSILAENSKLNQAAYLKAQDMIKNNYFAHYSPQGVSPWYWFDQVGYYYQYAGENLAMNFFDSQEAVTAWMNSPLHRENILNANYTETGIAITKAIVPGSSEEKIILVQTFGSQPKPKIVIAKITNTTRARKEAPARTTTKPIVTTTKEIISTTTTITIPTEVLGLTQINNPPILPPSDIRSQEEIKDVIKQTIVSKEQRENITNLEFKRAAFTNNISEKTWVQYQATNFLNNRVFKVINQGSGFFLIFLSTAGLFGLGKPKDISYATRKVLYSRNAILGAMGAGFLVIQPTVLFGSTIIPKVLN